MNLDVLIVALFGGILVLCSYWFIFIHLRKTDGEKSVPYNRHAAWLGLKPRVVNIFITFQILAIFGFITGIGMWTFNEDSLQHRTFLELDVIVILTLFFVSAMLWAPFFYFRSILTVVVLVITALASVGLLGIAIHNSDTVSIASWVLLCIVTVFIDAVVWNHYYIKS
jgi:hypothetical protein